MRPSSASTSHLAPSSLASHLNSGLLVSVGIRFSSPNSPSLSMALSAQNLRRMRRRFCALRAMERLGLLGEENLIPTLTRRPELRWLANEEGARWDVLAELGRIGDRGAFEEAVAWTLQNRPTPEQAGVHVRRLRAGVAVPAREAGEARGGPETPAPNTTKPHATGGE